MPSCVVKWCRSHTDMKNSGITFHVFPKNEIMRLKWVTAVRLERNESDWTPSECSKICSIHFRDDDISIRNNGKLKRLRKTVVPICTMVASIHENTNSSWNKSEPSTTTKEKNIIKQKENSTCSRKTKGDGNFSYADINVPGRTNIVKKTCNAARVIIANVYCYLQTEYENLKSFIGNSCDLSPLANILKRTAEATGVSEQTITRILEERKRSNDPEQETVKHKRCKTRYYFEDYDVSQRVSEELEIETLKVEIEEDEDQSDAVKERMVVDFGPASCQATSSVQLMLSGTHAEVKLEPVDVDYQQRFTHRDGVENTRSRDPLAFPSCESGFLIPVTPDSSLNPMKTEPGNEDQNRVRVHGRTEVGGGG